MATAGMDVREESLFSAPVTVIVESVDPLGLSLGDAKPLACRGCLAVERPLKPLQRALATVYGDLTGTTVSHSDIYPKFLCNYCSALLLKFSAFRENCLSVQRTYFGLHSAAVQVTPDLIKSSITEAPYPKLLTTYVQIISVDQSESNVTAEDDIPIKTEPESGNWRSMNDNDLEFLTAATDVRRAGYDDADPDDFEDTCQDAADTTDCQLGDHKDAAAFRYEVTASKVAKVENKRKKHPAKQTAAKVKKNAAETDSSDMQLNELKAWIETLKTKGKSDNSNTKKHNQPTPASKSCSTSIAGATVVKNDVKDFTSSIIEVNIDDASDAIYDNIPSLDYLAGTSSDMKVFKDELTCNKVEHETSETLDTDNDQKYPTRNATKKPKTKTFRSNLNELKKWVDSLKAKKSRKRARAGTKSKADIVFENKKIDRELAYNVKVVQLSKEEQIKQIKTRKDSTNYTRAAFKCGLCYRGFISEITFKNHSERHELNQGDYVCDVCCLRYHTKRKLDKHMVDNHMYDYICNECGFVSKSSQSAGVHFKWHRGVKYDCKICGKLFDKPTSVMGHMHLSHGGDVKCSICDETFLGRHGLSSHMSLSHKEAIGAVCSDCGVQFHSVDALRRHRPLYGRCDKTLRVCAACGEGFGSKALLEQHKLEQHKITYQCDLCSKTFDVKSKYKDHISMHTYQKALICEICGCSRSTKQALERHRRIHTGEKPFQCDHCGKRCRLKGVLQAHILGVHMGIRRPSVITECRFCRRPFNDRANLKRHESKVHQKMRPFQCEICAKTYQEKQGLQNHIDTKHYGLPWPKRVRNVRLK